MMPGSWRGDRWVKALPPLLLVAVVLALYGRALGRSFTSEDFLLIRFLGEHPPWRDLPSQLVSPWLGISVVKFYRPVSTLLYGLEIALFGVRPVGYNLAHVLVHGLNAALVWSIVRRLDRVALGRAGAPVTPLAAALLFAIHPLHPNAVIFSASFATLFGAAFFLMAIVAYQRFRDSASLAGWAAAMGCFLLALGSYEAAAVLPGVLAVYDHLLGGRRRQLSLAAGYLPFFGVLGFYFVLRRRLFGEFLGGYGESSQRLLDPRLRMLAEDLGASIRQLHLPLYDRWPGPWEIALTCVLLVGAPLVFWLFRRRLLQGQARLWAFGWAWCLLALAPFAFRPAVPGNGRYGYLAAAGAAMSLVFLARGISSSLPFIGRVLPPTAIGALAVWWTSLLTGYVGVYIAAGKTAQAIQGELVAAERRTGSRQRLFLTGHPDFLVNASQVPIAAVFHYGLRDAVNPPFVRARVDVYPLPPLPGKDLLSIALGAPESSLFEWVAVAHSLRRIELRPAPGGPVELAALWPPAGARIDPRRVAVAVAFTPRAEERIRLIVVSPGNAAVVGVDAGTVREGVLRVGLPVEFLRSMNRLYGGEHYWWLEVRDAAGTLSAFTRMRSFRVAG